MAEQEKNLKWFTNQDIHTEDGVTNPNYRLWITRGGTSLSTAMPENWSIGLDISWQPQFANLLQESLGSAGEILNRIASAGGYQIQNKSLSSNIWTGSSYVTLNIPFVFKVEENVKNELISPLNQLLKWSLPTQSLGMMQAPYSPMFSFKDKVGKYNPFESQKVEGQQTQPISVQFGNFFRLPQCVITNVNQSYDSIFDSDGKPLSGKIDVTVISSQVVTTDDLPDMYLGSA